MDFNYRSHYDGSMIDGSSIFTAPVKGMYSFLASIIVTEDIYFTKKCYKCYMNNNEIAGSIEVERVTAEELTGAVKHFILHTVLELKKNDKVELRQVDDTGADDFIKHLRKHLS